MKEGKKNVLILAIVIIAIALIVVFSIKAKRKDTSDITRKDFNNEEIKKHVKVSNVALTNKKGEVNLYNVKTGKIEKTINPFNYDKSADVLYSSEDNVLCGLNRNDNRFVIIDLNNFEEKLNREIFTTQGYSIEDLELSDNKAYFLISTGKRIAVVDLDEINEKEMYVSAITISESEVGERVRDIIKDKNEVAFLTDNFILKEVDGEIEGINMGGNVISMLTGKKDLFFINSLGSKEEKSVLLTADLKEFKPQNVNEMGAANPCYICHDDTNGFLIVFNGGEKSPFIAKVTNKGTVIPQKNLIAKARDAQTVDEVMYVLDEEGNLYFYSTAYMSMFKIDKIKGIDVTSMNIHVIRTDMEGGKK